jgi:hypothetical protein
MEPFESPFIGMTYDEVRIWMDEHRHLNLAEGTFVVVDEDTAKNKTCRIGSQSYNTEYDDRMLITDFYASMQYMVAMEAVTILWDEID